jgi:hypothetical protein
VNGKMVMVRYAIRNEVGDPRPDLAFAFDCTSCIIQLEKVPFEATNRFVIYNTLFYIGLLSQYSSLNTTSPGQLLRS